MSLIAQEMARQNAAAAVNALQPNLGFQTQGLTPSKTPMDALADTVNSLGLAVGDLTVVAEKLVPVPVIPIKDAVETKTEPGLFGEIEGVTRQLAAYRARIAQIAARIGEKL